MSHATDSTYINRIIPGDAMEILPTVPADSINLIITSPPYWGLREYGNETLGREPDPRQYVDHMFSIMKELKRVLHSEGSLYLNLGDVYFGAKGFSAMKGQSRRKTHSHYSHHTIIKPDGKYLQNKQLLLIPTRLAQKMQDDGWLLRNDNIWFKPNACPNYSADRRLPSFEHIFHFVKSPKYYFDFQQAKELKQHRDVIIQPIQPFGEHQATFPEPLVEGLILSTSRPHDLVLDTFMGSGTVAIASLRHDRNYLGIELKPKYVELANERIEKFVNPPPPPKNEDVFEYMRRLKKVV